MFLFYDKCTVRPFCLTFDDDLCIGSNGNSTLHSRYMIVFNDYMLIVICKPMVKQYLDKKIFIFAFDVRSKQLLILGILWLFSFLWYSGWGLQHFVSLFFDECLPFRRHSKLSRMCNEKNALYPFDYVKVRSRSIRWCIWCRKHGIRRWEDICSYFYPLAGDYVIHSSLLLYSVRSSDVIKVKSSWNFVEIKERNEPQLRNESIYFLFYSQINFSLVHARETSRDKVR